MEGQSNSIYNKDIVYKTPTIILIQPDICHKIQEEWNHRRRIGPRSFWDECLNIRYTGLICEDSRALYPLMPYRIVGTGICQKEMIFTVSALLRGGIKTSKDTSNAWKLQLITKC